MIDKNLKIAVLHGGPSSEHDISVWSSKGVTTTLRQAGFPVLPVYIDRDGRWHFGDAHSEAGQTQREHLPIAAALQRLQDLAVDVCFMGFHGTYGEDGKVQAALDLVGIPYTGSGPTASAVAMDKPLARRVFRGVGLPVAKAREVPARGLGELTAARVMASEIVADLGLPVVVKVPAGGSSVGIEIPRDEQGVADALRRLSVGVDMLLCEQFVDGVELTAGVLELPDGTLESMPIVEIVPKSSEFFDYHAKYQALGSEEIVPARISPEATRLVQELGRRAHHALGCRGVSRTDVILGRNGQPVILETNTLPGLTPASLLPKAAAEFGLNYEQLLLTILATALA
jgi:D-alanine-D-alanine ligase